MLILPLISRSEIFLSMKHVSFQDYDRRFYIFNNSLSFVGFSPRLRNQLLKRLVGRPFGNQLLDIHMARFTIHMVTLGIRRGNKSTSKI